MAAHVSAILNGINFNTLTFGILPEVLFLVPLHRNIL